MENLISVAKEFNIEGKVLSAAKCGNGRINRTFKITTQTINGPREYILQVINTDLFTEPEKLMANISGVTNHIKNKSKNKQVLNIVKTKNGEPFISKDGLCFRVYDYIPGSISIENPKENPTAFYECGKIFADFQTDLSDFDANKLHETIPDFHNTQKRFEKFVKTVNENKFDRVKNAIPEIEFCVNMTSLYNLNDIILKQIEAKTLPLRVTHNDTKLNNVAFNKDGKALAVLDLDTVMPGALCYDFGDAIRFGCNSENEESTDFDKITFDKHLFSLYTKGYLEKAKDFITERELASLVDGCLVMTYEVGMRFLTDYLEGDVYFGSNYPENNLNRARNQFTHLKKIKNTSNEMNQIVYTTMQNLQSQDLEK